MTLNSAHTLARPRTRNPLTPTFRTVCTAFTRPEAMRMRGSPGRLRGQVARRVGSATGVGCLAYDPYDTYDPGIEFPRDAGLVPKAAATTRRSSMGARRRRLPGFELLREPHGRGAICGLKHCGRRPLFGNVFSYARGICISRIHFPDQRRPAS